MGLMKTTVSLCVCLKKLSYIYSILFVAKVNWLYWPLDDTEYHTHTFSAERNCFGCKVSDPLKL